jgi:hypothetical protein
MDTADSLLVRARVVEELASYTYQGARTGGRTDLRWPTDRVSERIASRRSKLVAPYRSLLRVIEADRRPETALLSSDVWIIWEEGNFVVFFDLFTEHFGLAARQFDDIPTYWGIYGDLAHVLCAA